MPDEKSLFQTTGPTWAERAKLGDLRSVLSPSGPANRNLFLHGVHSYAARYAARFLRAGQTILDFGCGTGRFFPLFGSRGLRIIGIEITAEMAEVARQNCPVADCSVLICDGSTIPVADESIDAIWCCSVLRYSLLVENPVYRRIAAEMFRVLKPESFVFNCEMYLDVDPELFKPGFLGAGFHFHGLLILQRYSSRFERLLSGRYVPESLVERAGFVCAALRTRLDVAKPAGAGLCDYLFIWRKPLQEETLAAGASATR